MNDFEVHSIGHFEEIKLSRELANAIEQALKTYDKVLPHSVLTAYEALRKHYEWQIENGVQ